MSYLSSIEDALTRSDIPRGLRLAQALGARIGSVELRSWARAELYGYPDHSSIPEYRILPVILKGDFYGAFGKSRRNYVIASLALPTIYRRRADHNHVWMRVESIESTLEEQAQTNIRVAWSPNDLTSLQNKLIPDMVMVDMWSELPRQGYVSILDAVRNRLLAFALELKKEDSEAGEAGVAVAIASDRVRQIFNTHIYLPSGPVAAGSQNFEQLVGAVTKGDFESLRGSLLAIGLEDADIRDLHSALEQDGEIQDRLGEQVSGWLGRMMTKVSLESPTVSVNGAARVLGTAVGQYFDMWPGFSE